VAVAARWHPVRVAQQSARQGQRIWWMPATLCPCVEKRIGGPKPECKLCYGLRWYYPRAHPSIGSLRPPSENAHWLEPGMLQRGTMTLNVQPFLYQYGALSYARDNPVYDCGLGDRVLLCSGRSRSSEVFVRGSGQEKVRQAMPIEGAKGILICASVQDPEGDAKTESYVPGTDVILEGRDIIFVGREPDEGEQYSVTYFHRPMYECATELPAERRHQDRLLMRQFQVEYVDQVDAGSKFLK